MDAIQARQEAARFMGVPVDVEPVELKKLYRQLAKQCHPDRHGGDEARFGQLSWAYSVLLQPLPTGVDPAAAGWHQQQGQEQAAPVAQPRRPEAVPTVEIQRGVLTWVRTHVRLRLILQALAGAVVLLLLMARTGAAWWSLGFAVPLAVLMIGRAVWLAIGRPELPWFNRDRTEQPRRPRGPDDTPTGPIPVITPEMLQEQQQRQSR